MPLLNALRALLRPNLPPLVRCKAFASHTSAPPSASANSAQDSHKADIIKCLIDQGIPSEESEEIVARLSKYRLNREEIYRTLSSLNSFQFGQDRLTFLLKAHPTLVLIGPDQLRKCYCDLSSIFTQNYVYKLLLNSPSVVEQKRSELAEKINFLNKQLAIPNAQIVDSSALSYPLSHIKARSEFLKRCGILKPSLKRDAVVTVTALSDMFDTTDVQFATKVAKLTAVEYEAFLTLYRREVDSDSELESDSDTD